MSLSHRYEDFGSVAIDLDASFALPEEGLEEVKLDSFEDGYKAGWEDADKARAADNERSLSLIAQRLEDISFTQTEAIVKVNAGMRPLLSKITLSLLPEIAQAALGAHVIEQFEKLVKSCAAEAIEIAVAEENLAPLQEVLKGRTATSLSVTAEPTLSPGQVYLRSSTAEREINLDTVRDGITSALDAFFAQTQEELTDE